MSPEMRLWPANKLREKKKRGEESAKQFFIAFVLPCRLMDKNDDYNFESLAGTADFDEVI